MTLSKLAKLANVSISVASKAFSGKGNVSEAMRNRVFEVAKANGCFNQFYNIPYEKYVVALIIPEAISKYYIKYVEEIKAQLEKINCTLLLSISNFDREMEGELIRYYSEHGKVDALIVVNGYCDFPTDDNVIFVKMSGCASGADVTVTSDMICGIDACMRALKEYGHEKIAFVGEYLTMGKKKMVEDSMRGVGLPVRDEYFVISSSRFEEAGRDGVKKLLSLQEPPTAVIGAYGYVTDGIISELTSRNLSIPRDMSVISLDRYTMKLDSSYEIACIDVSIEELCRVAVEQIRLRLGAKVKPSAEKFLFPERFDYGNTISRI